MHPPVRIMVGTALLLVVTVSIAHGLDLSRAVVYDIPRDKLVRQFGKIPASQLTGADSLAIASYRFTGDTLRALAFLIEWSDRPGTFSRETIDSMLFSEGVYPTGSVTDYYNEVSYGTLTVTGDVIDWYDAGTYETYFQFESLLPQLDALVDFSQYDGDHDGNADVVIFIRSGNGMEDTQDPNDIWSYAAIYPPEEAPGPFDGVHIARWLTAPETRPMRDPFNPTEFLGVDTLNQAGVCAHELGHALGLSDLYDYDAKLDVGTYDTPNDYNDHPVVDWCLMGYGGYGLMALGCVNTRHLCGWSKMQLGWVEPVVLDDFIGEITINNIEMNKENSLFLLPIDSSTGEYFLLEYRDPASGCQFGRTDSDFSVYLWPRLAYGADPLERGLIITHVHDSLTTSLFINDGTPGYPHYSVAVKDAGYSPDRDASTNPEGRVTDSAQWWYPYETRKAAPFTSRVTGKESFGPDTYPNSDGYEMPTGIFVRVDSLVEDRLYAYVNVPSNNWRIDIESKTVYTDMTGASVGITAYWDMDMAELALPLVFRELESGSFWAGTLPVDTAGGTLNGVQWNWSNPGWADAIQEVRPGIPGAPCDSEGDLGYDGISPDHLAIIARSSGAGWTPPEPEGREIVRLVFDVGGMTGSFEIDTACFSAQFPGISMIDAQYAEDYGPAGPYGDHFMFNGGIITIQQALNPEIASTTPTRNAINDPATTNVSVTFAFAVDGSTINASSMVVHGALSGPHEGTITYDDETNTATFDPTSNFAAGEVVTVLLTNQILTPGGIPFGTSYTWSFTVSTTAGEGVLTHHADYQSPGTRPLLVTSGDIDRDGDVDLIFVNHPTAAPYVNTVGIWRNDGTGQFEFDASYLLGDEPYNVTTADFNADGYLDIVTTDFGSEELSFLMSNGDGTFAPRIGHSLPSIPLNITAADYNGDGFADISLSSIIRPVGNGKILIKLNQRDGTFPELPMYYQTKSFGNWPQAISSGDLDNDGDLDLVFAASSCYATAPNNGSGYFFSVDSVFLGYNKTPIRVFPADLDGDGDLDLSMMGVAGGGDGFMTFFQNDGQGNFASAASYSTDGSVLQQVIGDFDHDGDIDLVGSMSTIDQIVHFTNNGNGTFSLQNLAVQERPASICAGDFDGEGSLDIALVCENAMVVSVLLNCYCPQFCDLDADGVINPLDVAIIVNFVYRQLDSREPLVGCATANGDWDCNDIVNPVDVVWYVHYVYKQIGEGPGDPCNP